MKINYEKYPKIMQEANFCIPASVLNLLKYFDDSIDIDQNEIYEFCKNKENQIGLFEISEKLGKNEKCRNFYFIFQKGKKDFNSKIELLKRVKAYVKNGIPVIVNMKGRNGGTHMLTIFEVNDYIKFFDTNYKSNPYREFSRCKYKDFIALINDDLHILIIKPKNKKK